MENIQLCENTNKYLTCFFIAPSYNNLINVLLNCKNDELLNICNELQKIYFTDINKQINLKFIIIIQYFSNHYIECLYYLNQYFSKYKKNEIELIQILLLIKIKTGFIDTENDEDFNILEKLGAQKEFLFMLKVASNLRINNYKKALDLSYELFYELKKNSLAYNVVIDSAIKNNDSSLLIEVLQLALKNKIDITLDKNSGIHTKKLLKINIINILKKLL